MAMQNQSARWATQPTKTGIRQAATPASYNNGVSYYTTGKIQSAYIKGNTLHALVVDSAKHHVKIKDSGPEGLVGDCSCTYSSRHYRICKHVVATLMHLMEHIEEMLVEEDTREVTIKYMINKVSHDDIMKFLTNIMLEDEDIRLQFIKKFSLENIRLQRDYRAEIDRMYRNAVEADGKVYTNLDFEGYFVNARESQHDGEFESATKMFKGMSEIISERMMMVDDSDGYYTDCFIEALENMVESIMRERLSTTEKQKHITYLLDRLVTENRPKFLPQYRNALATICTQHEDLIYWQSQLRPHLEKLDSNKPPKSILELVHMQSHILMKLKDYKNLASFLSKFYHIDKRVCMIYLEAIHHTSSATAQKAAQGIVEKYPNDIQIIEKASEFYPTSSRAYATLLRKMFIMTGDWKYFFKLKNIAKNWNGELKNIVKEYVEQDPKKAIEIYLKNYMASEAMKLLEQLNDINLFEAFRTKLSRRYSSKYFAIYGACIIHNAGVKNNKKHYQNIQRHITSLKAIPGADAKIASIVDTIKKQNPKKRTLLDMIGQTV